VVFIVEMIAEYTLLPDDNTTYGYVEFGTVFFLYASAAFTIAWRTRQIRSGIAASAWAAMISSTIWLFCLLVITYLFRETSRQTAVFQAEGNFDDFRRSGMADFNTFLMQDLMGAAFFHLLLGPAVAALLGCVVGAVGKLASHVRVTRAH
jgi:hypothetical protein